MISEVVIFVVLYFILVKGTLKQKSLNVEECGHEIRNEFHRSKKSRGAQAIIIATQDRTSNVAVTYERSVSTCTAGSDTIPWLVQLFCGSTITRSVRNEELATWEETRGCAKGSERKQLGEGKIAFAYRKFSLSPTVYQRCIMLKTLQKITSDSEFTAYLVDVAEAFDKTSKSR